MRVHHFVYFLLLISFCEKRPVENNATLSPLPGTHVVEVGFVTISPHTFETWIDATGTVELERFSIVTEYGSSTIRELPIKNHQTVEAGDLLVSLKNSDVRVDFAKALEEYRKQRALYEIDKRQRGANADTAQLKAFYGLNYTEEVLDQFKNRMQMEERRAPFDGIISLSRAFIPGETLNGNTELMQLTKHGGGSLRILLPALIGNDIKSGMKVAVAGIDEVLEIKPGSISGITNSGLQLILTLPASHAFRDKERVLVRIIVNNFGTVSVIPREALLRRDGSYLFFTMRQEDSLALWIPLTDVHMNDKFAWSPELNAFTGRLAAIGNHHNLTHFQKVKPVTVSRVN